MTCALSVLEKTGMSVYKSNTASRRLFPRLESYDVDVCTTAKVKLHNKNMVQETSISLVRNFLVMRGGHIKMMLVPWAPRRLQMP